METLTSFFNHDGSGGVGPFYLCYRHDGHAYYAYDDGGHYHDD